MIDIKELGPEHIGKWVEYRGGAGETERGRIKSWTDTYVRVVYRCDNQWQRFQKILLPHLLRAVTRPLEFHPSARKELAASSLYRLKSAGRNRLVRDF
jgi:hypothetical protein